MNNLTIFKDFYCNPLDYKIKEKKLMPDFMYTKELLNLGRIDNLPQFSIDSLKMDIMQIIFVDNDCLKMKILRNSNGISWDIEGKVWECSDLFQVVLKEKELNIDRYITLNNPQTINEAKVPKRFKSRLNNFNEIFRNSEKEFFVFDAIRAKDPILVMQLNKNPDRNFLLGVWE